MLPPTSRTLWTLTAPPGDVRVVPDAAMDLRWLDGRFQLAGADTTAMIHPSTGDPVWGLRLAPGEAPALLGVPASEVTDQRVELLELIKVSAELIESAHREPTVALRRLHDQLWRAAEPDVTMLRLATSLDREARSGSSLLESASAAGSVDQAHFTREVRRLAGTTPAVLLRGGSDSVA